MARKKDLEEAAHRRRARTTPLRRALVLGAGWTFIVLGLAGLVLPFLQGILFLVIGAILLSSQSPAAARLVQRVLDRHPKAEEWHDRAERSLRRIRARHRLMRRRGRS
ncbi:PGPGW domain-containing protein [Novispirillum sp. DQ9]|uniref:PGPGW domain-containing protein n=1 Tax=Novispirillum sp. DQ9 TaxID=3398612 RepID=UPI003C7C4BFA